MRPLRRGDVTAPPGYLSMGLAAALLAFGLLGAGRGIDVSLLSQDLSTLASDEYEGREAGTAGGQRAGAYIAEAFERAHLEPAGDQGWFQPFTIASGARLGDDNKLIWGEAPLEEGREATTLSFSSDGEVQAPVVFVGYGLRVADAPVDDYAGLDVRGKVVLALSGYAGPPRSNPKLGRAAWVREKVQTAAEAGAAAFLYVRCSTDSAEDSLEPFSEDMARRREAIPAACITREALLRAGSADFAGALEEREGASSLLWGCELAPVDLATEVEQVETTARNVIGILPGSDPALREECVVIGAHYDHVGNATARAGEAVDPAQTCNGADDNASGASGVLALARDLAGDPAPPRRSVVFIAFDAEEKGLLGSQHYVREPVWELERTVAMVNLDMVGRLRDDKLWVFEAASSSTFPPVLESLASAQALSLVLNEREPGGSDHAPFLASGIPTAFFFTGMHPEYHSPKDDYALLNVEGEARVLALVDGFVRAIANADIRPAPR